jgi:hypothetical protein
MSDINSPSGAIFLPVNLHKAANIGYLKTEGNSVQDQIFQNEEDMDYCDKISSNSYDLE